MEIVFVPKSKSHLDYFKKTNNQIILKKIKQILESIQETPYEGIGKPEALKHNLTGLWSRRIIWNIDWFMKYLKMILLF